jgi:membrane fusion protein (multidrug efflux system)
MKKRMLIMLGAMLVVIAGLGLVKFQQIRVAIAQNSNWQPPPEAVTTIVARQEEWPASLASIGTVEAVQGVTVSADLPGIVEKIDFDSGRHVKAGQVLVRLDTSQERAQLTAAQAQWNLAKLNLDRAAKLLEKQVISQAEYDRMAAEYQQTEAGAGEIKAAIERKTIRAPFSGILGIRQVNLGQYLAGGDPVVPLQSLDPIYVSFDLPQQDVGKLRVGSAVKVATEDNTLVGLEGRISAINSIVDPATRNVKVQATLANRDGRLKPGMFVDVEVVLGSSSDVVALPISAVSYAPYGNSVFVVENMKAPSGQAYRGVRQQFVKLGDERGDQVAVVTGVKAGEEVVTSGVFKLRNGAAILINNKVQPGNDPAPKPEDS